MYYLTFSKNKQYSGYSKFTRIFTAYMDENGFSLLVQKHMECTCVCKWSSLLRRSTLHHESLNMGWRLGFLTLHAAEEETRERFYIWQCFFILHPHTLSVSLHEGIPWLLTPPARRHAPSLPPPTSSEQLYTLGNGRCERLLLILLLLFCNLAALWYFY